MRALCWYGKNDVRVKQVPDPMILNPRDAIIEVSLSAICGSDLHLLHGKIPSMRSGDILGHEFVGRVVATGPGVSNVVPGDRVVVPFAIACGDCYFCKHDLWSLCDNSNPNAWMAERLYGHACAGLFGYSHLTGGYAGGQAEFVRVPFADIGVVKLPDSISDEQALPLADILPTAFMAAENCEIQRDDIVAVWGCGPVGLLAIRCAYMLGAGRVIAIDNVQKRLDMASTFGRAETLDFDEVDILECLNELTGGRGPDACIDAVGMEADGHGLASAYDKVKERVKLTRDRPTAVRQAIQSCRKGGRVSVPGVYGGFVDKFPLGAAFQKGLTVRGGQTHVHRYIRPLLRRVVEGDMNPSFVITHRFPLEDAPEAYSIFGRRLDDCVKVVLDT